MSDLDLSTAYISSYFGAWEPWRREAGLLWHSADDLPCPVGTPLVAPKDGEVVYSGPGFQLGTLGYYTIFDGGESTQEDGSRLYSAERLVLTASDADPAAARLDSDVVYRYAVDGHDIDIRARGGITGDAATFDVRVELEVQLDGEPFFERAWQESIPRLLV